MITLKQAWYRLMGNIIRSKAQWRAWAIEQAVKSGSRNPEHGAIEILDFVFRGDDA